MRLQVGMKLFNVPVVKSNNYGVNVGWFTDQKYNSNTSIAQVARWNEYGTKAGIPERPFMRKTIANKYKLWDNDLKTMVQRALDDGKDVDKALKVFGEEVKSDIQDTIINGSFVKNSPITINGGWIRRKGKSYYVKGKGFDKPLIDTGIMVASIQARTDKELLEDV